MGSGSASAEQTQSSTQNRVHVPQYLQDFFSQATGAAGGALGSFQDLIGRDTVADHNDDQLAAMQGMRDFAGGKGGYLPTAQDLFMNTAKGVGTGYLDPALQQRLQGGDFDLSKYIQGGKDAVGFADTPGAKAQLQKTAAGEYLHGGAGFDAAVDAARRSAQPHIMSAFGGSAGGSMSGLAQTAMAQASGDAFAKQYGQERGRQIGAAESLQGGSRADRAQYLGFGEAGANRARRGDEMLAGLSETERGRQLAAGARLPDIGLMDDKALMDIGNMLQGQGQREIDGPMQNQLRMLQAALSGVPMSDLLGSDQDHESSTIGVEAGFGT